MAGDPLPRCSERLVLRRFREEDVDAFQEYRGDAEVERFQGWTPMEREGAVAFLREMSVARFGEIGAWFQVAIADRASDALLGDLGICLRGGTPPTAEIGFSLARPAQGRGLASEAVREAVALLFDCTGVERIEAITDVRNLSSIRLLHRLGMRLERTQDAIHKNEPCQEHVYVLDRGEWLSLPL